MHSISGSSIAGKYERLLIVIWNPARRNSSTVAFSRLPLGIPSFSFINSVPVDRARVVGARLAHVPLAVFEAPEKAALITLVANAGPQRLHLHQHRVAVAVGRDLLDDQAMAGTLAFEPQLVPRPAEERRVAGLHRLSEGLVIHEAHHQD